MASLHERMLTAAATMLASQRLSAKRVREESLSTYGALSDANLLATGALASALLRVTGKTTELPPGAARREALLASFMLGIDACEKAITEGYYPQASALLRQEMETIAALGELKKGVRKDRATPNVSHVDWSLSRLYGDLNKATHVADDAVVQSLVEGSAAPESTVHWRMYPELIPDVARRLYALHTMLMIQLLAYLDAAHIELHGTGLTDEEKEATNLAVELLVQEKCLERVEETSA